MTAGNLPVKPWWQSKIIWLNALAIVVWLAQNYIIPADFKMDQDLLALLQLLANVAAIVARRFFTSKMIG